MGNDQTLSRPQSTERRGEWVRRLGLACGSLLIAALLLEGLARFLDLRPLPASGDAVPAWVDERQLRREAPLVTALANRRQLSRYFELYEWDRFLFYRVRPHLDLEMLDFLAPAAVRERTRWRVVTNSRGFREREFPPRAPEGVFRLLVLGDSSTFGWGVARVDAYPSLLERELRRRHPGAALEVLGLGVPGYSSFQGRVLLERVGLGLAPDALLFSFGSNDRTPVGTSDREEYARRASFVGALQAALRHSAAYRSAVAWWAVLAGRMRDAGDVVDTRREGRENVTLAEFRENLTAAAGLARERDVPFAFVSNCLDVEGLEAMGEVARQVSVPFVNGAIALGKLREAPSEAHATIDRIFARYGEEAVRAAPHLFTRLPDRCHPNEVGHHILAHEVADVVDPWVR